LENSSPLILLIETATTVCSVALARGEQLLSCVETLRENSHSELINGFIEKCLSDAGFTFKDLSAVAVSEGPGSYTGLRIGASAAKAIAYSMNVPLIGYNTLEALAYGLHGKITYSLENRYISTIDARRDEVYIAIYDASLKPLLAPTNLILPDAGLKTITKGAKCWISGNAARKTLELNSLQNVNCLDDITYSAAHGVSLASNLYMESRFMDVAYFEPNYIKPFYTTFNKK